MNQYWIIVAILLPMIGGVAVRFLPYKKKWELHLFLEGIMVITSVIVWGLILGGPTEVFHVVHFFNDLSISFKIDGMTMVFAGLVSILWPFATLYAFEYMEHAEHVKAFFMFYVNMNNKLQQKVVVVSGDSVAIDQDDTYDYTTTASLKNPILIKNISYYFLTLYSN